MCIEIICDECKVPYRIGGPGYQPPKAGEHGIGFLCRWCAKTRPDYTMTPEGEEAFAEKFSGIQIDWVVVDECSPSAKPLLKLIFRQALYSLLTIAAVGVALAVFL